MRRSFMIVMLILLWMPITMAFASISDLQTQIDNNIQKVSVIQEAKTQLHVTANQFRDNEFLNDDWFVAVLGDKWHYVDNIEKQLVEQNENLQQEIVNEEERLRQEELEKQKQPKLKDLGTFTAYAYDPFCKHCCGTGNGITASGVKATIGQTIATDWSVIPKNSKVLIYCNGEQVGGVWRAEDTGGGIKGYKIDMTMNGHTACYNWGVRKVNIKLIVE